MHKEGNYKKQQTTLEIIIILAVVGIVAISLALLYVKSVHNSRLPNTDELLAVAYFSGANGQPICNESYGLSQCFEILLTEPLPPYPVHNATYWNNNEQLDPNFEIKQDNYLLWINSPYSNQFYFPFNNSYSSLYGVGLDNYGDVYYIGQVNGYYEYIVYAYPTVEKPAFVSSLELQYYSPNLLAYFNGATPVNTTYILPIGGKPIPIEMYLNVTSLVNLLPEEPVQVPNFDNVLSVTEVGLTTGDSLLYSETFANGTTNNGSFPITSNSESTFVISNITNQLPETVTLNVSGEYPSGKTFGKETFRVSDNTNVFINFTPPAPIELISTTNTIGPFVVTTNRNEPFSNLVITTGNTLVNGGTIDDAYITNVTSNHVEFFIKNPASIIYMNFNFSYNLNSSGPTGEAPTPVLGNPNGPYAPYDDGAIVFDKYTNFIGPSSGSFGPVNSLAQNDIISDVFSSGPFTFNANGNQTMSFTINDGFSISTQQNNGYNENLYLPIQNGETYILGGTYPAGDSVNIGIANSTDNYYDNGFSYPMWTNGVFVRGACGNIYLAYATNSSNANSAGCGSPQINFYSNLVYATTYATYALNSNSVTITFPDATDNKQFTEPLIGPYNFTMETFNYLGEYYYLAETSQPVQMKICQPPYSAPNTITCTT